MKVLKDGSVIGTLKAVTGYTDFSSVASERNGHFFPFTLNKKGSTMTIKKNGSIIRDSIEYDPDIVFRVTKKSDTFEVLVDGEQVVKFNFEQATLA